jgi:hypothetical protein
MGWRALIKWLRWPLASAAGATPSVFQRVATSTSDMATPNIDASQIGQLIERLMDLLSQQNQGACGPQGDDQGCFGNEQQEFEDIVNKIRSLGHQLRSLEPGPASSSLPSR